MMKAVQASLATLGLFGSPVHDAHAHDRWVDGNPVPTWVKRQCCGVSDIHHLRDEQVHVTPDGYKLDGYHQIVHEQQLTPSPDGEWWVFYHDYPDGSQSAVFCFFGPVRGS